MNLGLTLSDLQVVPLTGDELPHLTIALVGQPNVGKSTVFNHLTGLSQHVGNWAGKTTEHRTAVCETAGALIHLVDLPGSYSLDDSGPDERFVRDFLIREKPDAVIVIASAATLEHNLYLLAEILALPFKAVLGVNMVDVASHSGIIVEPAVLSAALGLPVVALTATRSQGLADLIEAAVCLVRDPAPYLPNRPEIRADHREVLNQVRSLVAGSVPGPTPTDWAVLKLLEGDTEITARVSQAMGAGWLDVQDILRQHDDLMLAIASGRYEWIARLMRAAVVQPRAGQLTLTDRIDRVVAHPYWGLAVLAAVLGVLFWLTYALGSPVQTWMEKSLLQAAAAWLQGVLGSAPAWLRGLAVDGILTGVGSVLTLLPILLIFFAAFSTLEDVGYMARAAFVMDRFMHKLGLHGQSFLPLFLGFGCNVPAVMGTRIIDSPKARLATILITPLVPCTARLAVITLLAPIFFGAQAAWVALGLVILSLLVMIGMGMLLHRWILVGEQRAFIMELPLYHFPNLRTIGISVWARLLDFFKMAGSIILVVSILLWAFSHYPGGSIETSYLAMLGRIMAPLGGWMGLEWPMLVALLASFIRKENTIPTLAVLYGGAKDVGLAAALSGHLVPAAALAFLAVQVLFIPCLATLATIRQETRSWRWTLTSLVLLLVISMSVGIIIYQGARLIGSGV